MVLDTCSWCSASFCRSARASCCFLQGFVGLGLVAAELQFGLFIPTRLCFPHILSLEAHCTVYSTHGSRTCLADPVSDSLGSDNCRFTSRLCLRYDYRQSTPPRTSLHLLTALWTSLSLLPLPRTLCASCVIPPLTSLLPLALLSASLICGCGKC